MLRNYQKKTEKRMLYTEDIVEALVEVNNGASVRNTATKCNIPSMTLYQRFIGRSKSPRKIGCKTSFP